jgi:hypothetical protein
VRDAFTRAADDGKSGHGSGTGDCRKADLAGVAAQRARARIPVQVPAVIFPRFMLFIELGRLSQIREPHPTMTMRGSAFFPAIEGIEYLQVAGYLPTFFWLY